MGASPHFWTPVSRSGSVAHYDRRQPQGRVDLFDVAVQAYRTAERERQAFIDPTGLVPVVNEVEWFR
jgi:hypothetical protein